VNSCTSLPFSCELKLFLKSKVGNTCVVCTDSGPREPSGKGWEGQSPAHCSPKESGEVGGRGQAACGHSSGHWVRKSGLWQGEGKIASCSGGRVPGKAWGPGVAAGVRRRGRGRTPVPRLSVRGGVDA
jgi:hypothetical protein